VDINPVIPPPALVPPPPSDPPEDTGINVNKAKGVMKKFNAVEGDRHFNAVAEIRLRTNHFEQQDPVLTPEEMEALVPPEDVDSQPYAKFLAEYAAKYIAATTDPDATPDPLNATPPTEPPLADTPLPAEPQAIEPPPQQAIEPPPQPPIESPPLEGPPQANPPDEGSDPFAVYTEFLDDLTDPDTGTSAR